MSAEDYDPDLVLRRIEEIMKVRPILKSTWELQRSAVQAELSGYFIYRKTVNEIKRQEKWQKEYEEQEKMEEDGIVKEPTSEMEVP